MKMYSVKKYSEKTNDCYNYGILCEADMKATVKGYKQWEFDREYYFRKSSQWYFIVKEVEE